jgi:hypothetical protein
MARKQKKILNRGNELKDLLEKRDLAFLGGKNEPSFEPQNSQTKRKNRL